MREELKEYLRVVAYRLKLDTASRREVLREIYCHLEERTEELMRGGMAEKEAVKRAMQSFGLPQTVAREFYQAHSQGGWVQALVAALPHFLASLLFAFHLWQQPLWLFFLSLMAWVMVAYGWKHGKPAWLFPWLSYSLLPLLGVGLFLFLFPPWSYLGLLAYIPVIWWLLSSIAVQTIKRDWLYASLLLLPYPILTGWLLALRSGGSFSQHLARAEPWIALSFFGLGLTVVSFIRTSQRRLKTGVLLTPELAILVLLALTAGSFSRALGLLLLALLTLGLLLSPRLLERRWGESLGEEPWLK